MSPETEEIELYDGETETDATAAGAIEDDDPESEIGDEVAEDDLDGGA
jgi:hypothetical protein